MTEQVAPTAIDIAGVDLTRTDTYRDGVPHAAFRRLRREAPVCRHPETDGPGFWAVTRHDDVMAVSRDSGLFSSEAGGVMTADSPPEQLAQMRQMMLTMDPPRHTRYRLLVNKGFTPRMVNRLNNHIDDMARAIVDKVARRGECDFVTEVAGELPSMVIAELMGIPLDDGRKLYQLTETMHTTDDGEIPREIDDAQAEMFAYSQALAAAKRAEPGDDIASALLAAEIDGDHLSDLEFNLFFMLLINAGGDTTRNLVASGVHALIEHPDQRDMLLADPDLLPSAIEEMLRFVPPVMVFRRTATRDTMLGGVPIRAGDKVVLYYPSANRDESIFDDPDTFDITRQPNPHVAFGGGGAHFCLGANLARVEINALLREALWRLRDLELAGPPERLHSNFLSGYRHMPVRFTASVS
jgi:cytochrome P450